MKVTVVIPCRNEENYIKGCIESILSNDYPDDLTEIIVVDGLSNDKTPEIIKANYSDAKNIKLFTNEKKTAPYAFNIGIENATGDYIIIIGAHSFYPKNYISKLISWHKKLDAYNVGGILETDVRNKNKKSLAIIEVLSSKFGVGNASFRTGIDELMEVDTVAYGCYKKECFEKFGLFNTDLTRNQDIEYNKRIVNNGGKIYLVPDVKCKYFARETFNGLARNNYLNGLWNILTVYLTKDFGSLSLRHFIPLFFVLSLFVPAILSLFIIYFLFISALSAILYITATGVVSAKISARNNSTGFIHVFASFVILHFSYGIGSLIGLLHLNKLLK